MRRTNTLIGCLLSMGASAQMAVGAFGGAGQDLIWQTEQAQAGALFEFRVKWLPPAVVRTSAWYCPQRGTRSEVYHMTHDPVEYTWLAESINERHGSAGIALDLRFPFEHNACSGGYFKGTYLLAGLGYARRWQRFSRWSQDREGHVTASVERRNSGEPMLRAGFGGEWNFSWGGPFIEGIVTISAAGSGPSTIRFPGAVLLNIGYRYSFAKAAAPAEEE